ncbi:hypothetical protein ZIOFF_064572 [Zingiber officinale]|uniref:Uncharacterized protein n=1 Tax=Zingiber officinale TaxID=94328 RepID=A0A8J5EW58_ZINOF|nr:hypothetical protein ZIOFF_064572 [Zingiber officinale]
MRDIRLAHLVISQVGPNMSSLSFHHFLFVICHRVSSSLSFICEETFGNILINGQKQKLAFGTLAYVTQDDVLMTMLTNRRVAHQRHQWRRVSIYVELLTRPPLLFLDEPTIGIDSAAAYHVVHRIASLARRERMTVVAAVHQPSSEVLDLFDRLCLLAYGNTVFFGLAPAAAELYASNSFACPSLRNPSDHYLRTINKDLIRLVLLLRSL